MSVQLFDPLLRFCANGYPAISVSVSQIYILTSVIFITTALTYLYLSPTPSKMLLPISLSLLLTTLYTTSTTAAPAPINREADPTKSLAIKSALTNLDAFNPLLDSDWTYNFNNITSDAFNPGSVPFATGATWPILARGHCSVSQINLGPCAMLSAHSHPRASKIAITITGSIRTFVHLENGGIDRETLLTPGLMTYFPRGSMHVMQNTGCTNAILYAVFDSSDPGVQSYAQAVMSAGPDVVLTMMPFIQQVNGDWNQTVAEVPVVGYGAQPGPKSCLTKCGMGGPS